MENYLNKLPQELRELIRLCGEIASLRGMSVYLIGGFVRDLILGVKNLDLDMAVEGEGIVFAEDLSARLNARIIRHKRFGTATVILGHYLKIDIATARREVYLEPASLPEVEFGSLKDDLIRRDFTINAMAINITKPDFGKLMDFSFGRQDLLKGKIRVLHKLSFIDDPTRILRAVRFEQRYGFKIEPVTLRYLKHAVDNKMLEKVQPQRLRDELILILKETHPLKYIKRMEALKLLGFISPKVIFKKESCQLLKAVEKEIDWFNSTHSSRRKLDIWLIYFIGLIDSLSLKDTKAVCKKLVFSKGEEKRIFSAKKISDKFIRDLSHLKIKPAKIFSMLKSLSYENILLIKAKYKNPYLKKHIEDFLEIYTDIRVCVSGHELHKMGIAPGPLYQKIFAKVLKAKLNGLVKTEEEEMELIKKLKGKIL
ncbi:MAG: hypothetical protein ABIH18_08515 [Candidatus Omnitrophota bacterium]